MFDSTGWNFVWSAYGIVYAGIVLYAVSLGVRRREIAREQGLGNDDL